MRATAVYGLFLSIAAAGIAGAQTPAAVYTAPAALLAAVAKVYAADVPSFHIESDTETVRTSEMSRDWEKSTQSVAVAPGGRFRIEARSNMGDWFRISDGVTEWGYVREGGIYTKGAAAGDGPHFAQTYGMGMQGLKTAWDLRTFLEAYVEHAKAPTMLPDETVTLEGRAYPCYVVHATFDGQGYHGERTFWVEKSTLAVREVHTTEESAMLLNPLVKIPMKLDTTTLYPVVEFGKEPDPKLFAFAPPAEAKEVAALEPTPPGAEEFAKAMAGSSQGKRLPALALPGADGKPVSLASFKGHPLVIDVWATWCGSCLVSMPSVGQLAKEVSGLQVLTIDRDEDAGNATRYLAAHGFTWPNLHDADGALMKALGERGIPLTLLVDAEGRVVYRDVAGDQAGLRKAIAALPAQAAPASAPASR